MSTDEQVSEFFAPEDMSQVAGADELFPEGQFHFRVSEIRGKEDSPSTILVFCRCQTEGAAFGRSILINVDKSQTMGMQTLKSLYKATGYNPGPGGHDPMKLVDGEFKGTVKHNVGKDKNTYSNIAPYSIKPLF